MQYIVKIILCIVANFIASIKCKKNAELFLEKPYSPAYDIIHHHFPVLYIHAPDYLIIITSIGVYIKYLFASSMNLDENINSVIYSLMLRSITTQSTITSTCMPKPKEKINYYSQLVVSTHDLMFSGHTVLFIFLGKCMTHESSLYLNIIGNVIQYIFPISLILSRQHYTNDVIMSIIVYNFFYQYFCHYLCYCHNRPYVVV